MKYFLIILLLLSSNSLASSDFSLENEVKTIISQHQAQPELAILLEKLFSQSPKIKALFYQLQSKQHQTIEESWLNDPKLSVKLNNIPVADPSFSRTLMSGKEIGIEQEIPFPTKLIKKNQIGKSRYNQEFFSALNTIHQTVHELKQSYFELSYLHQALKIHQDNLARYQSLNGLLQSKYTTDEVPLHELLESEIQTNQIELSIIQLQKLIEIYQAQINSMLAEKTNEPIKPYVLKSLNQYPKDLEKLYQLALKNHPEIQAAASTINQKRLETNLAKQSYLPDFRFMASYRIREDIPFDPVNGENFFSGEIGVTLPFLWSAPKHHHKIQKEKNELYASKEDKEQIANDTLFDINKNYQKLEQLKLQISIIQNQIIPKQQSSLNSSLNYFEAQNYDFKDLVISENSLFNYQLSLLRYQFNYEQIRSDLELAVGNFF